MPGDHSHGPITIMKGPVALAGHLCIRSTVKELNIIKMLALIFAKALGEIPASERDVI